jgi:hypothetical protein
MTGAQMKVARDALCNAFDYDSLSQLVLFRMDIRLRDIVAFGRMETVAFHLLESMEQEGRSYELMEAAYRERPQNTSLRAAYEAVGLAPQGFPADKGALERVIFQSKSMLNMAEWCAHAARVQEQVCRVEIEGNPAGTGFLVGPDTLLTNYHVLERVIKKTVPLDAVRFRFGFKPVKDAILSGFVYQPQADRVLDHSPYSQKDLDGRPLDDPRSENELDYALVRLAGEPGRQKVDPKGGDAAPERGYITVPRDPHAFGAKAPLHIVQHPKGTPLKLALDTEAIVGVSGNRTRVRYTTNTDSGSSGSPCFDAQWQLAALHHYGDPDWATPQFNQGIPVDAIRALLSQRGKGTYLAPEPA